MSCIFVIDWVNKHLAVTPTLPSDMLERNVKHDDCWVVVAILRSPPPIEGGGPRVFATCGPYSPQ